MSKRTTFTTVTALPSGVSREIVVDFLRAHHELIDLNPLVQERHPMSAPDHAPPEERSCVWWSITDRVNYLPGGAVSSLVNYSACFHDLPMGVQTHSYAPLGLDIRGKWTVGGSLPGEPYEPVELGLGAPETGLYLREDVDMRCNFMMTSFVKSTLKKSHAKLVDRLCERARTMGSGTASTQRLTRQPSGQTQSSSSPHQYPGHSHQPGEQPSAYQPYREANHNAMGVQQQLGAQPSTNASQHQRYGQSQSADPMSAYVGKSRPGDYSEDAGRNPFAETPTAQSWEPAPVEMEGSKYMPQQVDGGARPVHSSRRSELE